MHLKSHTCKDRPADRAEARISRSPGATCFRIVARLRSSGSRGAGETGRPSKQGLRLDLGHAQVRRGLLKRPLRATLAIFPQGYRSEAWRRLGGLIQALHITGITGRVVALEPAADLCAYPTESQVLPRIVSPARWPEGRPRSQAGPSGLR